MIVYIYILYYNVLYYIVILYYVVLYYIMLYYIILCYVMLYYVMLYYIMFYYIILCYIMLYYIILCYIMLCNIILCFIILCCITLYYVILYYVVLYYIILCCIITHVQDTHLHHIDVNRHTPQSSLSIRAVKHHEYQVSAVSTMDYSKWKMFHHNGLKYRLFNGNLRYHHRHYHHHYRLYSPGCAFASYSKCRQRPLSWTSARKFLQSISLASSSTPPIYLDLGRPRSSLAATVCPQYRFR